MLPFIRKHFRFFLFACLAAFVLRAWFVIYAHFVTVDSTVYADIAKNWLNHHVYGISDDNIVRPTLIRLPGYPAFLAAVFLLFGQGNFTAVMWVQLFLDLLTCFVVADLARRTIGESVAKWASLLAALCPFISNYVALPLTETLAILCTAVALDLTVIGIQEKHWRTWIFCGFVVAFAILLRPDSGLLLGSIGLYLLYRMVRVPAERQRAFLAGIVLACVSLSPLVVWTLRNWRTFHVFQPLVTFDASDPGEFEAAGWRQWMGTWLYEYVSQEDFLFRVSGEEINIENVPPRAFTSEEQRAKIKELFDQYNENKVMTPELDAQFRQLAKDYARTHPMRAHLVAPAARLADMWFRPRIEMLSVESRWWQYENDPHDFWVALTLGLINVGFVALAVVGVFRGRFEFCGLLLTMIAVRSVFLMYAGVAEPRYVLECFPALFVLGAGAFRRRVVAN